MTEGMRSNSNVCLSSHLNIIGVVSSQASPRLDPTHPECSGQGGQDLYAQEECSMLLDAVDYEIDDYKAAMCDPSDGGIDVFFRLEHSSRTASVPCNKVYFFFPFFYNVKMRAIPYHLFFVSI